MSTQDDDKSVHKCISAVALATYDMAASVAFYEALGFELTFGGVEASFSTLRCGVSHLNLALRPGEPSRDWWGRVIFHVADVDAVYARAVANGYAAEAEPADASWGERYFHIIDPAGHQLSFAKPL